MKTSSMNYDHAIKIHDFYGMKENLLMAAQQYLSHMEIRGLENQEKINVAKQFFLCVTALKNKQQLIALMCALLKFAPEALSLHVIQYLYPGPRIKRVSITARINHGTVSVPRYEEEACNSLGLAGILANQFPPKLKSPPLELSPMVFSNNVSELPFYDRDITSYQSRFLIEDTIILRQENKLALFKRVFYKALEASEEGRDKSLYTTFCNYEMMFSQPAGAVHFSRRLVISDMALIMALESAAVGYLDRYQHARYSHAFGIQRATRLLNILTRLKQAPHRGKLMSLVFAVLQLSSGKLPNYLAEELVDISVLRHDLTFDYLLPAGFKECSTLSLSFFNRDWYGPEHSFAKISSRYFSIQMDNEPQAGIEAPIQTFVPLELTASGRLVIATLAYKALALALLKLMDGFEVARENADMHAYKNIIQRGETPLRLFFSRPPKKNEAAEQAYIDQNAP